MTAKVYGQPGHPTKKVFIDDQAELRRALQNMVKLCDDFLLFGPDGDWYLPARQKGNAISEIPRTPWFVGGAVTPFEHEDVSRQRIFKRELGKEIDLDRLIYLRDNRYYMNGFAQSGRAHDAYCRVHAIILDEEEIRSVKMDPEEYDGGGLKRFGLGEIETLRDEFVRQILLDLWHFPKVVEIRDSLWSG